MRAAAVMIRIAHAPFDPQTAARSFAEMFAGSGAVVTFLGQVRDEAGSVDRLLLEHYPGFAERGINDAAAEACRRWPLDSVVIVHRTGSLAPREPIVFAAAASARRRAALVAVDFLMDHLKCDAPFWMQEVCDGEACWIEPRAEDYKDKARWAAREATES